jgi:hypothetical protein
MLRTMRGAVFAGAVWPFEPEVVIGVDALMLRTIRGAVFAGAVWPFEPEVVIGVDAAHD